MAVVAATRDQVAAINDVPFIHRNYRTAEAFLQGMVAILDGSGYVIQTNTAPGAGVEIMGLAMRRSGISESLSLFQEGFISGFDVSGKSIGAPLYAGADGEIADAGTVVIGKVLPFGYGAELMAYINVLQTWNGA